MVWRGVRVVTTLTEADYRAIPALSATGMRHLLRSPKHYRYYIDNPGVKAEFDFGHAVHGLVLGVGAPLVEIPDELLSGPNRAVSSNEAKAWVAEARESGAIPLKAAVIESVNRCAEAVLLNPKANWLLSLPGDSEVAYEMTDAATGVRIKSRLDRSAVLPDGRLINIDLKTASDVRLIKLRRHIEDFGYDIQSEVYREQLRQANPGATVAPTHLIFVEDSEPHEVRVIQLAHEDWINGGRVKMRRAIDTYAACVASGEWPGADDSDGPAEALAPRGYYLDDIALED